MADMPFYSLAELLEAAIQDWCASQNRAPLEVLEPHEISELAFALAEALVHRTDLPIEPPSSEFPEAQP